MIFRSTYNKPILLVGNGARISGAHEMIGEFCKNTNMPALTTMIGVDMIQGDNHLGFIGTHGNRIANMIINECDLIISVGARLGIRQVGRYTENFAPKAKLIRVDIDQNELSRNIKNDEQKIQMDAKEFIRQLLAEDIPDYSEWKKKCFLARDILKEYDKTEGNLAVEKISSLLPENTVVAVDVGQNQCWAAQSLNLKGRDSRILIGGGFGAMGCGLPYSIGASIANCKAKTYCITGDGGLQMNIQEFETVVREKLPVKIFVLNNRVLGKISETQHNNHNERYAQTTESSGYSVPDFSAVAEAYGIKAASLKSYQDLDNYYDWILDDDACLFDISLSSESYLLPKIKWETSKIEPKLPQGITEEIVRILSI